MEDGVIFIDLEVFPLKVNWFVPSLAPPFNFTTKEFTTCLALLKYTSGIRNHREVIWMRITASRFFTILV